MSVLKIAERTQVVLQESRTADLGAGQVPPGPRNVMLAEVCAVSAAVENV